MVPLRLWVVKMKGSSKWNCYFQSRCLKINLKNDCTEKIFTQLAHSISSNPNCLVLSMMEPMILIFLWKIMSAKILEFGIHTVMCYLTERLTVSNLSFVTIWYDLPSRKRDASLLNPSQLCSWVQTKIWAVKCKQKFSALRAKVANGRAQPAAAGESATANNCLSTAKLLAAQGLARWDCQGKY